MGEPSTSIPGQPADPIDSNKRNPNGPQAPQPAQPPPPGYQPPPPGYQQPPPGYGQPLYPSYNQPPPGYNQPISTQPMQPGYGNGSQQQQSTVVITNQPGVVPVGGYSLNAQAMTCPFCQASIVTSVDYESGTATFVFAWVLCFVGCSLGCCLIPFCIDSAKDAVHSCPNCKRQLGRKGRF